MIADPTTLGVVGLSHHTAPIEVRERFAVAGPRREAWRSRLVGAGPARQCVVLSTCNRTEVYVAGSAAGHVEPAIREALGDLSGLGAGAAPYLFSRIGFEAVRHLFRVTSGLDSLVIGEPQIQGQVRRAYQASEDAMGPSLHRLFQSALAAGGRVRASTAISRGATSIPAAAVGLARKVLGSLEGRAVLVLGTGEMGRLTVRSLRGERVGHVFIASRTLSRAERVARELDALPLTRPEAWDRGREFDLVVTATDSEAAFVTPARLAGRGESRPTVILDISVPRNVAPSVGDEHGIFLYNVDDLQRVVDQANRARGAEFERAEAIVDHHARRFWTWHEARVATPIIRTLRETARSLVDTSLERGRAIGPRDADRDEELRLATRSLLNKILHGPTRALRRLSEESGSRRDLEDLSELVERPPVERDRRGTAGADTG